MSLLYSRMTDKVPFHETQPDELLSKTHMQFAILSSTMINELKLAVAAMHCAHSLVRSGN